MENKKLVKILLRDVGELEELIAEMKSNRQFDAFAMEFIHTRAKGVLQVLHMLETHDTISSEAMQAKEKTEKSAGVPEETVSGQVDGNSGEEIRKVTPVLSPAAKESQSDKSPEEEKKPEIKKESVPEVKSDSLNGKSDEDKNAGVADESREDEDMLEEDSASNPGGARLGDSFLKGKSINDLITDQQKLEFKLSNRPVSSIRSAIGINDRFQYIRELFDGDSEKFMKTVKDLDAMDHVADAVNYLRTHFRWKKNETSLKFVNLVKRRFLNG